MNTLTDSSFRLTSAYLLPGFVLLGGLSFVSPTIGTWLAMAPERAPSVGGFMYATLASLALGLLSSTVRWLVVDSLHHATGLRPPIRDYSKLADRVAAFTVVVHDHFVYYKFHANMLVAIAIAFPLWRFTAEAVPFPSYFDGLFVIVELVLFAGSRDTLAKYYDRLEQVLATGKRRKAFAR